MTRRIATVMLAASLVVGLALPAFAAQVSGVGKTRRGATLGLVAKSNLSGHLRYISAKRPFSARCTRYTSFRSRRGSTGGWKARITATCHQQDGQRAFLKIGFVDRGEPGSRDRARILWGRRRKVTWRNAFLRDRGRITAGNIQLG